MTYTPPLPPLPTPLGVRCEYCKQWALPQSACEHCGAPTPALSQRFAKLLSVGGASSDAGSMPDDSFGGVWVKHP